MLCTPPNPPFDIDTNVKEKRQTGCRGQLKCDGTGAETRFRLSEKRTSPFKSAGGHQFSRLLAAEVRAPAVVTMDTPCSEVVWRVWLTQSIRQFPLHFPSRASRCAITFPPDTACLVCMTPQSPCLVVTNTFRYHLCNCCLITKDPILLYVSKTLQRLTAHTVTSLWFWMLLLCNACYSLTPQVSRRPSSVWTLWLTLRWLMSYIYGAPILDVSRSHTTTQHSR